MSYLEIGVLTLNILSCIPSIASLTRFDQWWIRAFDFPRIQISFLVALNILLALYAYSFDQTWHYILVALLGLSLIYQFVLIFPYTWIASKQVISYAGNKNNDNISILVSNVLTTNRNYDGLIDLVKSKVPDILLTLESDKRWEEALEPVTKNYKHRVEVPLDNLYGMHLYSKLELHNIEVKYLVEDDIPSIHGNVELANGKMAAIHCLHPKPPSPTESKTSTNRDAELLIAGKDIGEEAELTLVFGDLNDVAWSRTTKLFQRMSGLMDPRRGRGFFNTFNADNKILRWPLDHVFHSKDFTVVDIARCENIGSDHFPMYIKLNYTPRAQWFQEDLKVDEEEEEWAEEKIEKANPKQTSLSS